MSFTRNDIAVAKNEIQIIVVIDQFAGRLIVFVDEIGLVADGHHLTSHRSSRELRSRLITVLCDLFEQRLVAEYLLVRLIFDATLNWLFLY